MGLPGPARAGYATFVDEMGALDRFQMRFADYHVTLAEARKVPCPKSHLKTALGNGGFLRETAR
jgi:hypothetical protein